MSSSAIVSASAPSSPRPEVVVTRTQSAGDSSSQVYFKREEVEATLPRSAAPSPAPVTAPPTGLAALAEAAAQASPMVVEPALVPPVSRSSLFWRLVLTRVV